MMTTPTSPFRGIAPVRAAAALLAASLIAAPLAAQDSLPADADPAGAPAAASGALDILENVQLFGSRDSDGFRGATARVNGDIITATDVDQRAALVLNANENELSEEDLAQLRAQVLRNLIDEMLQIQEARASDIEIPDAEVEQSYNRVAQENFRTDPGALDKYLREIGSSPASLKQQIRGELAWQRLLRRNVAPFVNVSEEEVSERLARLEADKGTEEYRIGEIFLSATEENKQQVAQNATRIMEQLRQGGSFVAYARQFSEASTAAVGGDLGWIRLAQLPPELSEAAAAMQPGQLVGPIEIPGGFSLLYLIDKRQVLVADPRDALLSLKQISISFPPGTDQETATARASAFAEAVGNIRGCGEAESGAAAIGAEVVTSDNVRVRDLPGSLQASVLQLAQGETTQPFGSVEDGVRVLMLCGRDDPQTASGANFDQLIAQIEDERIGKRAQLYLRDLRRDAIVEYN